MIQYYIESLIQQKNVFKTLPFQSKMYAKGKVQHSFKLKTNCSEKHLFRYEDHNEMVKKTIPKEKLLVWNLKDGWEPLCTFLDVPIPDVPIPKENTTGDFNWAQEYFLQDPVTRNGIKYLVCYCILIIVILFCVIYFPIKYA